MASEPANGGAGSRRILHLGLGSFHRAHQALYLHRLRAAGDERWSITGGSLRDDLAPTLDALALQGGRYTLETVSPQGERRYEWVESIAEVVRFDPTLARLIEVGADPATAIVSFTVTEAGYYLDAKNRLDLANPDLAADLAGGRRTIYGALAAILSARVAKGGAPVTLLNCDNLRSNGARSRAGLLEFLERRGERALRDWVVAATTSPSAMVDRITPRPPVDLVARVRAATGRADAAPVMAESFIQWVIEDDFAAGRPEWESAGVEMVASVHAHEEAKIRVLNATHSCVAWAGLLKGLSFIHEDMAVPAIRALALDYVAEVIPCLDTPAQPSPIDLARYRDVVLERFGNPHVQDTNARVAMDGYSKIPGFVVPTLRERLETGRSIAGTAMLPALFFACLMRWHRGELAQQYQDGVMDPARAHAMLDERDPLGAFCREPLLWGPLLGDARLEAAVRDAHDRVLSFVAS
ncbi:MAG TPA: D-arabinitol 4-dehydrogenase [Caldimonas sp.]|nr:D-arabinitol 4-dehydrogenase [Caldimonas sp.]